MRFASVDPSGQCWSAVSYGTRAEKKATVSQSVVTVGSCCAQLCCRRLSRASALSTLLTHPPARRSPGTYFFLQKGRGCARTCEKTSLCWLPARLGFLNDDCRLLQNRWACGLGINMRDGQSERIGCAMLLLAHPIKWLESRQWPGQKDKLEGYKL